MKGYQLSFFTQNDRKHGSLPLSEWLLKEARKLGIPGVTIVPAAEGYGHDKKLHSSHFFELSGQPIEIKMAVSAENADRIFRRLKEENINIFFIKTDIEFGITGNSMN